MPHFPTFNTLINNNLSALMYVVPPTNSVPIVALVENVRQIGHISTVEAPILDSTDGDISIAMILKATALGTSRFFFSSSYYSGVFRSC